jgi:hypothetical protein
MYISRDLTTAQPAAYPIVFRRGIALLLIVCFGFFFMEVAVADVHDGDAPATEVAKAPLGGVRGAADDARPPGTPIPAQTTHEVHVCHCVHAHGITPGQIQSSPSTVPAERQSMLGFDVLTPDAVDRDRHLRPPIRA